MKGKYRVLSDLFANMTTPWKVIKFCSLYEYETVYYNHHFASLLPIFPSNTSHTIRQIKKICRPVICNAALIWAVGLFVHLFLLYHYYCYTHRLTTTWIRTIMIHFTAIPLLTCMTMDARIRTRKLAAIFTWGPINLVMFWV